MNEILSNNLSEKCLREIGIVFMKYINEYCSVKVSMLQHNIDMNIDHSINMLFKAISFKMNELFDYYKIRIRVI